MNDTHDVISAFLDDEPFDPNKLTGALSDPAGRTLLIDLIALRHLMQPATKDVPAPIDHTPRRSALRALVAVAAVLVALVGGYVLGQRRTDVAMSAAPPPTRVVQASAPWQNVPLGRSR